MVAFGTDDVGYRRVVRVIDGRTGACVEIIPESTLSHM